MLYLNLLLTLWAIEISCAHLEVGAALNVLSRYGFLSITMRMVPRNDSNNNWLFREPTFAVFKQSMGNKRNHLLDRNSIYPEAFHLDLCDNTDQLFEAYFRGLHIELLDKPWKAFTSSWSSSWASKSLGINSTYLKPDYGYVLLRLSRSIESDSLPNQDPPGNVLSDNVISKINLLSVGDVQKTNEFVRRFGTHYISSYVTGNSIFQVMVFSSSVYQRLKAKLRSLNFNSQSHSPSLSSELVSIFSPWNAEHIGTIQTTSGNSTVTDWANTHLRVRTYFFSFPSLLKVHGNFELQREVNKLLKNEALLELSLKALSHVFPSEDKQKWFNEILNNKIKLWEVNM